MGETAAWAPRLFEFGARGLGGEDLRFMGLWVEG